MKKTFTVVLMILFLTWNMIFAQQKEQVKVESPTFKETSKLVFTAGKISFPFTDPCPKCLEWIKKNNSLIQSEFEKALTVYPALTYSFTVLVQEVEFLNEYIKTISRHGYTPYPEGEKGEGIITPEELWHWLHKERIEYFEKMVAVLEQMPIEEEPQEVNHKWNYCNDLERRYNNALECVKNFIENPPTTDEEWEIFQRCLDTIQEYIDKKDYCRDYY